EARVVLEVDLREPALAVRENLVLVFEVILVSLEQDHVEFGVADLLGGDLDDVVRPGERAAAPAVPLTAVRPHGQDELTGRVREVVEVAPVDVPGEYAGVLRPARGERLRRRRRPRGHATLRSCAVAKAITSPGVGIGSPLPPSATCSVRSSGAQRSRSDVVKMMMLGTRSAAAI